MSRWQRFSNKDDVMKNDTRNSILELIKNNPGMHFREACRKTGKEIGVVQYHLRALVKFGLISSRKDGRFMRYYHVKSGMDDLAKVIIANMNRPVGSELLSRVLLGTNLYGSTTAISKEIGVTPQALLWHLHRMVKDGLMDERWKLKDGVALKYHEMEKRGLIPGTMVDRTRS